MRLAILTAATMIAFAANSVLNRLAVGGAAIDPGSFSVIRVLSGAVMLTALAAARGRMLPLMSRRRIVGAGSLALYMIGFSVAYLTLDAGLGALILFGVVQITMFAFAAMVGHRAVPLQIAGAAVAFAGLVWVLWPAGAAFADPVGAGFMAAAGFGWALYTLSGRAELDALAATAANFCLALPVTVLAPLIVGQPLVLSARGAGLAILSGAVTSGLGYALWYEIVPRLSPQAAATVQLSVPVIALVAGVLMLGESAGIRILLGAAVVIGGIALALRAPRAR